MAFLSQRSSSGSNPAPGLTQPFSRGKGLRRVFLATGALLAIAAVTGVPLLRGLPLRQARFGTTTSNSHWGGGYIPNLPVVDQDGNRFRFYDDLIKGKKVIVSFIFTSCSDICPLTTARMAQLQARLGQAVGRDVFMYSITIDPEHDGPEELK